MYQNNQYSKVHIGDMIFFIGILYTHLVHLELTPSTFILFLQEIVQFGLDPVAY